MKKNCLKIWRIHIFLYFCASFVFVNVSSTNEQYFYNPSLSIRANQRNLVSYGLELSSSTIQRWKELYIDNPQLVQSPLELPKSGLWDSSFLPKFSSWGGYSLGSEM